MAFFEYLLEELDDFLNSKIKPIACKSSGAFFPDPKNYSNANNRNKAISPIIDAGGSVQARSQVLTDEKLYRNDFTTSNVKLTGTINFTSNSKIVTGVNSKFLSELNTDNYIKLSSNADSYYSLIDYIEDDTNLVLKNNYISSGSSDGYKINYYPIIQNGTVTCSNSICQITSGTITNSLNGILIEADSAPLILNSYLYLSQRINNQDAYIGFVDDYNQQNVKVLAVFDGTNNSKVKFITSSSNSIYDSQETLVTMDGYSNSYFNLQITTNQQECSLYINSKCLATHDRHIPDSFTPLYAFCGIKNKATVTNGIIYLDTLSVNSCNKLEVTNSFTDSPISIVSNEAVNTISSKLITNSTTANQIIISYTVPAEKSFYINGYSIMVSTINGDPVIIGKNTLIESAAPGIINGDVFRSFYLLTKTTYSEKFNIPIKIASAGDIVKFALTPSGVTNTTWRASLDFILR